MSREPSFCYICLDNEKRLVNMDRIDSNKVKLLDMLTCLSFETSCIEDYIPMYICDDCHKNVRATYQLKVMCQKNNVHVRRYIFYLKQFTHPTLFTNEPDAKNNAVQKAKPPESTEKPSDDIITIQMDLTDIGDESVVETSEVVSSESEQNTVPTEVSNHLQPIAEQQCEMSILSKRPEFNSSFKQSQLLKVNAKSQIGSMKIIKSSVSDTTAKNRTDSANEASTVSSQTRILSNRPEFNVYRNANSQNHTKTNSNNKQTASVTEQSVVHSKPKPNSSPPNNVINSTNKKSTSLKETCDKNLEETENENRTDVEIEMRPEFVEFDIISTVKLRKRGLLSMKSSQPMNTNSFKKRKVQTRTYHVKKDRRAIQRMNRCTVVLQRCEIIVHESQNREYIANTDETNHVPNEMIPDDIFSNSDDKESIEIKEETTNELDDCTDLQNNTLLINNTSEEPSVICENILIKQEIFDDEETINSEVEVKKPPVEEDDEFSFKIEIVDDSSSNNSVTCYGTDKFIKLETISADSISRETSVPSTETGMNNSLFSPPGNAECLITCEQPVSLPEDLTTREQPVSLPEDLTKTTPNNTDRDAVIAQGSYSATVGNGTVTKSTDKPVELMTVIPDNSVNTTADSDVSGELIIDEDKPARITVPASSSAKPAISKILSPTSGRKNILKKFLNFTTYEPTVSKQASEQGHSSAEKLPRTDGSPAVNKATTVKELNKDLSTVQLPNYRFPVSKRLLNFSSKEPAVDNSAASSSQVQIVQHTHESKPNCKISPRKTTVTKPASHLRIAQLHNGHRKVLKSAANSTSADTKVNRAVKSTSTLRKLPKKAGNPVIIGTSVGKTEESPVDLSAKQIQLMHKYMGDGTQVGINGMTTKGENICQLTAVGSSEQMSEAATSSVTTVESSKKVKLFSATSNGSSDVPVASVAHVEGCSSGENKCTEKSPSHFDSHGLVSPSKVTIEKGAAEFVQPEDKYRTINQHKESKSLKCPVCNKYFRTIRNLKKHALIHKNFYHCPICTENFSTKTKFKVHMLVHEERKHKCLMCDVWTSTNTALIKHYKTAHTGMKICGKCKLIFKTDTDLIAHMKRHYSQRFCTICNELTSARSYKTHMLKHERSKCSLCDKYVDTKLHEHNCTEHWEKTYKCTECDREFYFQHSLEKHMMVHHEMQCFICHVKSSKPHAIVEHMSKHVGPNGYQCPICDLCTFSKDSMKLHMTGHNGQMKKCTA